MKEIQHGPLVAVIYAASENDVIGKDNDIPWKISADLKRFKRLTTGYPIIMGRKTFESLGRPLPKRRNMVVTRNVDYHADGIEIYHSLEDALAASEEEEKAFVIGGAGLFAESIEKGFVNTIYFTRVHAEVDGDVFCPLPDEKDWTIVEVESNQADEKNEYAYTYITLERK
jgi:dihydrofolate reductase